MQGWHDIAGIQLLIEIHGKVVKPMTNPNKSFDGNGESAIIIMLELFSKWVDSVAMQ